MKVIRRVSLLFLAILITFGCPYSASALTKQQNKFFGENNIIFYQPGDSSCDNSGSGTCTPPTGDKITWIGDSYSVGAAEKIKSTFPGVDLGPGEIGTDSGSFIQSCKFATTDTSCGANPSSNPSGLKVLQGIVDGSYGEDHKLREYLVFALATNGGLRETAINSVIQLAGQNTKIIFVTPYTPNGNSQYAPTITDMKNIAAGNPNVYVADWAAVAKDEYYDGDSERIHPVSNGGYDMWVKVIANALPQNCTNGGTTSAEGVTTTTYNGQTIAFPIAGATKSMRNQVSDIPCNHSIGCHYGAGNPSGLAAAAFDICMGDNCDNQTVVAVTSGTITRDIQTTRNGANCNHVRIKSDIDGTVWAYMHLTYEDLSLHAGDHVNAGQVIGHIHPGVHPCNDNSVAHVHIDKGRETNTTGGPNANERDPAIVGYINAAYAALPDSSNNLTRTANYSTSGTGSGTASSFVSVNLPESTKSRLDSDGVTSKAQENMERYTYAAEQTGIPWQALAAIHYREAGMRTEASLSNGDNLYDHVNVDGIHVGSDARQDAVDAANHLKEMARNVYGVELSSSSSLADWGNAFLAYNRGYMYKSAGNTWEESPYVVAGLDDQHPIRMRWLRADSYYNGVRKNSLYDNGGTNSNPGALAVMAYLGGVTPGSSTSVCISSSGSSGGAVSGGLTEAQAKAIANYYKSPAVTASEWNLPSTKGKWNCVSFTAWFVQRFTTIGRYSHWPNGKDVASSLARAKNLETSSEPRPFSVFSVTQGRTMCGSYKCGHTGIVVAVDGDTITTIEAAYGQTNYTAVVKRSRSYFINEQHGDCFAYLDSVMNMSDLQAFLAEQGV